MFFFSDDVEKNVTPSYKLNPTNIALLLQEATQKYRKLIIEENIVISLPFSLFTVICASFAFPNSRVFSVLGHSTLQNFVEF